MEIAYWTFLNLLCPLPISLTFLDLISIVSMYYIVLCARSHFAIANYLPCDLTCPLIFYKVCRFGEQSKRHFRFNKHSLISEFFLVISSICFQPIPDFIDFQTKLSTFGVCLLCSLPYYSTKFSRIA